LAGFKNAVKSTRHVPISVIALLLVSVFGVSRLPGQYVFTANLFPAADATIVLEAPDNNYGTSPSIVAGFSSDASSLSRALIRFDLSSLPTNAIVTNITLTLTPLNQPPVQGTYFLSPMLTNWVETQVTWNSRSSGMPWSQPGGDFTGETGYAFLSNETPRTNNAFTDDGSFPGYGLVADAQSWIDNPAENFGWILTAWPEDIAGSAFQFGSREDKGAQPVLTVSYTLPFTPVSLTVLPPTNGLFYFTFNVEPFHGYRIQSSGDLSSATNWSDFQILDPPPFPTYTIIGIPMLTNHQFFRVVMN
jgi:hypothetical protein